MDCSTAIISTRYKTSYSLFVLCFYLQKVCLQTENLLREIRPEIVRRSLLIVFFFLLLCDKTIYTVEFLGCLIRLYECEAGKGESCGSLERCKPTLEIEAVEVDEDEQDAFEGVFESENAVNAECRWKYFGCGRSGQTDLECRAQFYTCLGGSKRTY